LLSTTTLNLKIPLVLPHCRLLHTQWEEEEGGGEKKREMRTHWMSWKVDGSENGSGFSEDNKSVKELMWRQQHAAGKLMKKLMVPRKPSRKVLWHTFAIILNCNQIGISGEKK
jgi:hypothetical protein